MTFHRSRVFVSASAADQDALVEMLKQEHLEATASSLPAPARVFPRSRPLRLTCSISFDGKYQDANDMFLRVWGYTLAELRHSPVAALMRPGERMEDIDPDVRAKFKKVMCDGSTEVYESWSMTKDGRRIDYRGSVTWVAQFQRWDVILEVDAGTPTGSQFRSPEDHLPFMQWRQAFQARTLLQQTRAIDELRGQVLELRQSSQPAQPPATKPARVPRHHHDKAQFLAQLEKMFQGMDRYDFKIETVRNRLNPKVTEHTLRGILVYHGLLIESSVKKSLDVLFDAASIGRLLPMLFLAILFALMLDAIGNGRLDGLIQFCREVLSD